MTQIEKLLSVLGDGRRHTVPELIRKVYGIKKPSSARLAARIHDLRRRGFAIHSDPITPTKWWYQMEVEKKVILKKKVGQ